MLYTQNVRRSKAPLTKMVMLMVGVNELSTPAGISIVCVCTQWVPLAESKIMRRKLLVWSDSAR